MGKQNGWCVASYPFGGVGGDAHWQGQVGRWGAARSDAREYPPLVVESAEVPQDRRFEVVVATKLVGVFVGDEHEQ